MDVLGRFLQLPKLDVSDIKALSNRTLHNASIFQDGDSLSVAILFYALSKILDREGKLADGVRVEIQSAKTRLQHGDEDGYRETIQKVFEHVRKADHRLRLYIIHVINQAEIKKGTKLYEHGLSLAKAASLMGVSQWELMSFVGKVHDDPEGKGRTSFKDRMGFARRVFGL